MARLLHSACLCVALLSGMIAYAIPQSVTDGAGPKTATTSNEVWKSLTTGRDYKIRREGDYIYTEWVNMPQELQGTPAFTRSELKKDADGHWRGKAISYLPFEYSTGIVWTKQLRVNWCRFESPLEFISISESRIEGIGTSWEKFDAKKCQPKSPKPKNFTLVPKN